MEARNRGEHYTYADYAPMDVRLNADTKDDIVLQPDLLVLCDPNKISNGKNCVGAPDMVVEILSHSTKENDRGIKLDRYLEAGVREYWIVDPSKRIVIVYQNRDGVITRKMYEERAQIHIGILDDCIIDLAEVFR